jgi:DNA-directed RNA polymerase omega subunit
MARYTSEKAAQMFGNNRFNLVLGASQRARELKNGSMQRVEGKDATAVVTALREIEQGKYTVKEWLDKIPKKRKGNRDEYNPT